MQYAFGLQIPETLDELCHPERMALLVYDMQVGVVNQIPDAAATTQKVTRVLSAARGRGVRVFFSRHISLPNELAGATQLRRAMLWQHQARAVDTRPAFPPQSPQARLLPELAPRTHEAVFDKITMSFFEGTPVGMALRDCQLMAFAIVGVALEVGIGPTVRHGADLGFVPVVVADACGSGNLDAGKRSLESLAFAGDAIITDTDSFCGALTAS
jgi:nicotinamidase-related amidase